MDTTINLVDRLTHAADKLSMLEILCATDGDLNAAQHGLCLVLCGINDEVTDVRDALEEARNTNDDDNDEDGISMTMAQLMALAKELKVRPTALMTAIAKAEEATASERP